MLKKGKLANKKRFYYVRVKLKVCAFYSATSQSLEPSQVMKVDNKTYWVDRFDHKLTEDEYSDQKFMEFYDAEIALKNGNRKLFNHYLEVEEKLINFIIDISRSIGPDISKIQYKIWKKEPLDFYLAKDIDKWKLEMMVKMSASEIAVKIENLKNYDEFRFLIELALREKVELRFLLNQTVVTFGWELKILFQCIEKDVLQIFCKKHGVYIIDEWYRTFWNE